MELYDIVGLTAIIHIPMLALFTLSQSGKSIKELIASEELDYDFYFGMIFGSSLFIIIFTIIFILTGSLKDPSVLIFYYLQIALFGLYKIIIWLNFWYKAWKSIQDGHASTTPAKAIGFLFIPLFNLYWIFKVFLGFAEDYNSFLDRHRLGYPKLKESLFLIYSLFLLFGGLLAIVPFGFVLLLTIEIILIYILVPKICNSVNLIHSNATFKLFG